MKKLLIIFLIFCCSKFTLVAQQITSNLTLITTDLMSNEQKSSFNWQNISYPIIVARYYFQPPIEIMVEPVDGAGGVGGNGGTNICYCVNKGGSTGILEEIYTMGMILSCYKCVAGGNDCFGTPCGPINGGSSGSNAPFNWGIWGNQVSPYTPFNYPPPSPPLSGSWGSGGGSAPPPPSGPSYPPPTKPVDDPHGGTNNPQKKDTLLPTPLPCSDTANRIGDSLTNLKNNFLDTIPKFRYLQDSCFGRVKESAVLIRPIGIITPPFTKFIAEDFIDSGNTQSVQFNTTQYTYIIGHTHTEKDSLGNLISESPSVTDFFTTMDEIKNQGWFDSAGRWIPKKVKYFASFIQHLGQGNAQYFVTATDTSEVNTFYYPNLVAQYVDTANKIFDSTAMEWVKNNNMNSWNGDIKDPNSLRSKFLKAINEFQKEGYPAEKLNTYANIYVLNQLNIPLKIYAKDSNGNFKQLNFTTVDEIIRGKKIVHFRITICN